MRKISDLTKDTRPSLEDILQQSILDTVELDLSKPNDNLELVEYENRTFYYRVLFLFTERSAEYYEEEETEEWCKKKLLKEVVLPKLKRPY